MKLSKKFNEALNTDIDLSSINKKSGKTRNRDIIKRAKEFSQSNAVFAHVTKRLLAGKIPTAKNINDLMAVCQTEGIKYNPEVDGELFHNLILACREYLYWTKADLNWIDTSEVTIMRYLFAGTGRYDRNYFEGNISEWDVSHVTDMEGMFFYSDFNGDISEWDVSNVKNMKYMFANSMFTGDIAKWNTSNVEDMKGMFLSTQFNCDISNWDIRKVKDMSWMFAGNYTFNHNLNRWDVTGKEGCDTILADSGVPEGYDPVCKKRLHHKILEAILHGLSEALVNTDLDLDSVNSHNTAPVSNNNIQQKYTKLYCHMDLLLNNILELNSNPYLPNIIDANDDRLECVEVFDNKPIPYALMSNGFMADNIFDFKRLLSAKGFWSAYKRQFESAEFTGAELQLYAFNYIKDTYFHAYNAAEEIHIDKDGGLVIIKITDRYYFILTGNIDYNDRFHYLNNDTNLYKMYRSVLSKVFTSKIASEMLAILPIISDENDGPILYYRYYKYKPEFIKTYINILAEKHKGSIIPNNNSAEYHSSSDIPGLKNNIVLTFIQEPGNDYIFKIKFE